MFKKFSQFQKTIFSVIFLSFFIFCDLHSHSGRTDNDGCHNDKKQNTKHCHQSEIADVTSSEIRVIDGDTIELNGNKIRFSGIDAPELGQICQKNSIEIRCGNLSKDFLATLTKEKNIRCIIEGKDFYGRLIGECFVEDRSISSILVKNGFAFAYQKYSDAYVKEEEFAKMKKLGLWNMIFEYPWIYRKDN